MPTAHQFGSVLDPTLDPPLWLTLLPYPRLLLSILDKPSAFSFDGTCLQASGAAPTGCNYFAVYRAQSHGLGSSFSFSFRSISLEEALSPGVRIMNLRHAALLSTEDLPLLLLVWREDRHHLVGGLLLDPAELNALAEA